MIQLRHFLRALMALLFLFHTSLAQQSSEDFLALGDQHLAQDLTQQAIQYYEKGIQAIDEDDDSLVTILSLYTNCGSAYSSLGQNEQAVELYQKALVQYARDIEDIVETSFRKDATDIAAQASFFLGMVYQDLEQYQDAVDSYTQAHVLDPYHWAAVANLAAVYHDSLSNHRKALQAYNQAYEILTQTEVEPTDAPGEPRFILSQLQYRIGLCISHDLNAKCALEDAPETPVSCQELATNAFAQALQFDPDNESAKHMLATITADATLKRASNDYVKSLFDDYAGK
jgi:tetratricopeptide (TPR) repeat protein